MSGSTTLDARYLQDDGAEHMFGRFSGHVAARFLGFIRPYRLWMIGTLAVTLLFVACNVAIPLMLKMGIDSALDGRSLKPVLADFIGVVAVSAASSYLQERMASCLAQQVIFDLRTAMFAHLQDVSLAILDQTHVGRIMSRLQGDVNALQEFLETSVSAVGDFFLLFGGSVVLLVLDWRLGLLTISVVPALVGIRALWLPRVRNTFRRAKDASSIVNAALAENINGVRTVIAARREDHNATAFERKAAANRDAQIDAAWAAQIMVPVIEVLTSAAQCVIVIAGGYAVATGRIQLGLMVAFLFYVQRFFDPVRTLSQQYTVMQRAMAGGQRIFEVLDVPIHIADAPDAIDLAPASASIEFEHVTFGYRAGHPVLHDLSFRVEPGEMAALVGPTGSGKTSVAGLIKRFHEPWAGQVRMAGHDVRSVTQESLGRTVAIVLQEPFLFTGTIVENIRLRSGAPLEAVIEAAKAVDAHDFIEALPDGYDTRLHQRGQNLSLGQRQLLVLARALIADPAVLILDEATANVDSFTEQRIQVALKRLLEGRTSLIIAHRLATVRTADRILVLEAGRLVEQGRHEELIEAGGLYARLCERGTMSFDDAA